MITNGSSIETATQITLNIVSSIKLVSSTKDSLHIKWEVDQSNLLHVTEYKLRYQAEGSSVVQYSHKLTPHRQDYDITQLHEDTVYKLCVQTFTDLSRSMQETCFKATTSTDSLSVALGSTFGAFLALGVIVLFVFLAKIQHTRRQKKRMKSMDEERDPYESIDQNDPDLEISDASLQVNEGTTKYSEFGSEHSQASGHNGITPNGIIIAAPSLANCSECSEVLSSSYPGSSYECCLCNHDSCCRGECDDPECHHVLNPQQYQKHKKRQDRDKMLRPQRSFDSRHSSSKLPHQLSVDSYTSSKRGLLPHQLSVDSYGSSKLTALPYQLSVDSYGSNPRSLHRQRSRESESSFQSSPRDRYLPTSDICCDCYHNSESCQQCHNSNAQSTQSHITCSNTDNTQGAINVEHLQPNSNHSLTTEVKTPTEQQNSTTINPFANPDGRPPDVRPKVFAKSPTTHTDYTNKFPDEALLDPAAMAATTQLSASFTDRDELADRKGIRPNLSCPNW